MVKLTKKVRGLSTKTRLGVCKNMALRRKHHNSTFNKKRAVEHNGMFPYLARYLEQGQIENVSENTTKRRDGAIRRFIEWCDEWGIEDPREITKPHIDRYQRHLFYYRKPNGDPLSPGSQHVLLTPIKSFFKWLTKENYLLYNPASEMTLPRKPKRLPRNLLTIDEVQSIIETPDIETPEGIRDRAIIETLYATGIRRAELCGLKTDSVDHQRKTLFIKGGKGDKDRYVPLGDSAHQWIMKYLQQVRDRLLLDLNEPHLFLTDYGEPYNGSYLGHQVKNIIKEAGITVEGSCHLFRHAMATHMLENGADVRFIQMMLGHADLNTTQIYTQVSLNKLSEIHRATHPGNLPSDS